MRALFGPLSIYTAVLVAGAALFFLLHHAGNQLPYEVAKQRFQADFDPKHPSVTQDAGYARGFKSDYEYCEISAAVMAGAQRAQGGGISPFRDALLVRGFVHPVGRFCPALREAAAGGELDSTPLKTRYWWGGKALYAIALRSFSVHELRELTKTATRLAYALLAVAALLLSPRLLAVLSPLLLLGAFHSGIEYFADVAGGLPYAWAVLSAAVLALLMRFQAPGAPGSGPAPWGRVRLFCFVTGMVSSYLWLKDGHTFLAVTLIGLIAYFGHERAEARERIGQAVRCMGLYLAGFLLCYGLGLLVRTVAWGGIDPLANFLNRVIYYFERTDGDLAKGITDVWTLYLEYFHILGWSGSSVRTGGLLTAPADEVLTALALSALAAALLVSAWEAYRARFHLLPGVLWIVALMLINLPNFIVSELPDLLFRTSRFLFVMYGLCFSCLILAILEMRGGGIRSSLLAAGVTGACLSPWVWVEYAAPRALELIEDTEPVIRSRFDVYHAHNHLIYTKELCTHEDATHKFFLHVIPRDSDDLESAHYFNNLDFHFIPGAFRNEFDYGRCVTIRRLPAYAIERFRTGQFYREELFWQGEVNLVDRSG